MNREVLPEVKAIMKKANTEAINHDDKFVRPEHIVISMIMDSKNMCSKIITKMEVDVDDLYDKITEYLRNSQITLIASYKNRVKLPLSDESKKLIKNLDSESQKLNDDVIDVYHIMLSLLTFNEWGLVKLLNENKITYESFKNKILDMNNEEFKKDVDRIKNSFSDDEFSSLGEGKNKSKKGSSKSSVLDNFCEDISKLAEEGKLDPVIGREVEIKRVSQILSRRKKNNPLLIGEPGVGKTAIVEGLAMMIKNGKAPRVILDKRIYSLDLASLVAGTKYRGQFEERVKAILEELKSNPNAVLFIDEVHNIVGAGGATGSMDAANLFKPALSRGQVQVIGATTIKEYQLHIEKDGALVRRFSNVEVDQPTIEETKTILHNIKEKYENHHKVTYTDDAIDEIVKMSERYIADRAMPDKAIDVLDEAGSSANVNQETPENIKKLEAKRDEIINEKVEVVKKQKYEDAAKLRDEEKKINAKLDESRLEWESTLNETRTIIDVDKIAEIVSMMTKIPVQKISSQENRRLMNMDKELTGKVIGQDNAVSKVVQAIKRNRLGIKDKNKPIGSFIFLGPTGVGKTYLAKLLAEQIFGDSEALIRMDMSEYMEKHSVARLIGAPPGYVGHEDGGQLTERVRRKPYSVILFDEIEKAHDDSFNLLLQLLDEGQLTDSLGRTVDFKNCLIIMTSNVGVAELNNFGKSVGFETDAAIANEEERSRSIIEKALKKKFKPEFLNRLDETIIFNSLKSEDINVIIHNELDKLKERVNELGLKLKFNKNAIEYVAKQGYDEAYGARPLNRAIQRYIEDPITDEVLSGNFKEGDTIKISYNKKQDKIVLS